MYFIRTYKFNEYFVTSQSILSFSFSFNGFKSKYAATENISLHEFYVCAYGKHEQIQNFL